MTSLSLSATYQILVSAAEAYTRYPEAITADNLRAAQAAYKRAAAEAMTDDPAEAAATLAAHVIRLTPYPPSPEAEAQAAQALKALTLAYEAYDEAEARLKYARGPEPELRVAYNQALIAKDRAEAVSRAASAQAYPARYPAARHD